MQRNQPPCGTSSRQTVGSSSSRTSLQANAENGNETHNKFGGILESVLKKYIEDAIDLTDDVTDLGTQARPSPSPHRSVATPASNRESGSRSSRAGASSNRPPTNTPKAPNTAFMAMRRGQRYIVDDDGYDPRYAEGEEEEEAGEGEEGEELQPVRGAYGYSPGHPMRQSARTGGLARGRGLQPPVMKGSVARGPRPAHRSASPSLRMPGLRSEPPLGPAPRRRAGSASAAEIDSE